jgi:hypothetical protein
VNFFRDLFVDLVDKRLWPVAALLVGALVIVPIALTKSAPSTKTSSAVPPNSASADLPRSAVSVGASGSNVSVQGRVKDPFKQQHAATSSGTSIEGLGPAISQAASNPGGTSSLTTNPSSIGSSSGGSSGGGSGSSGGSSGGSGKTNSGAATVPSSQVEVSFGKASGSLKTYKLSALSALPGNGDPVLIFTGLLKDGKTAVFLVSSDATAQGDGKCAPSKTVCSSILMKAGDTEFLDVATVSGGTVQYELDMKKVLQK